MAIPIRPIRNESDHRAALAEIERLFDCPAGSTDSDRLEVLTVLVEDYEARHHALPAPDPVEFLVFAMRAQGRTQADLAQLLGSRSRASEILNRRRSLSAEMVDRIASAWSLPAELLRGPYDRGSPFRSALLRTAGTMAIVLGLLSAGLGGAFWHFGKNLPDAQALAAYDVTGSGRSWPNTSAAPRGALVPLAEIPGHVVKAFLAAEDQNFYAHGGYDPVAIIRAALFSVPDAFEGRRIAGAATITQQLAKNILLAGEAPGMERKIKEIILARRLEQSLSKERILELYLNAVYFGGTAYGIGPAAEFYFGKRPADLSVAEAAYLAALPKAPNFYRIDIPGNTQKARDRRDWVLARMADDGLITETAAHFAQAEPLVHAPSP